MTIAEHLTAEHRHCDTLFSQLENVLDNEDWDAITTAWRALADDLLRHFAVEEETLFPAFEAKSGITQGPTRVMRMEHDQMRELLAEGDAAVAEHDAENLRGVVETLLIMNQQHNLKEENVLYPMCDQLLGTEFVTQLQETL
jgi:DUF438 domain-containing protein